MKNVIRMGVDLDRLGNAGSKLFAIANVTARQRCQMVSTNAYSSYFLTEASPPSVS
jgi:hypothetical protein